MALVCFYCTVDSCQTLLSRDLKRNLFKLFANWGGSLAKPLGNESNPGISYSPDESALQFSALSVSKIFRRESSFIDGLLFIFTKGHVGSPMLWPLLRSQLFVRGWDYLSVAGHAADILFWKCIWTDERHSCVIARVQSGYWTNAGLGDWSLLHGCLARSRCLFSVAGCDFQHTVSRYNNGI